MEQRVVKNTNDLTVRFTVSEFFDVYDIKKSYVANKLGVKRQQITNWDSSPVEYLIEYNPIDEEIKIIKPEEMLKKCKCGKLETK